MKSVRRRVGRWPGLDGCLLHTFKHEGYEAAWQRLVEWRGPPRPSATKRRAANRLLKYVAERRLLFAIPSSVPRVEIGSGPTEAQCKLTVGRLMG